MGNFSKTKSTSRAVIVATAPVVLLAAMIWHPYLPRRLPDHAGVAEAITNGTTRWGLAHLAAAVASGVLILAFIAIRGYLREGGDEAWSAIGLGFIVVGSVSNAVLPGMEFAPLAAVETRGDPEAAQAALDEWFVPVLLAGALTFAIGIVCVAVALLRNRVLNPQLTWVVVAGLVVMAACRLVPFAVAQFYVQSAAALVALLPLAWVIWTGHGLARSTGETPDTQKVSSA
jgi:hypothetical protein